MDYFSDKKDEEARKAYEAFTAELEKLERRPRRNINPATFWQWLLFFLFAWGCYESGMFEGWPELKGCNEAQLLGFDQVVVP